ncbi:hypothetical protein [Methylobacterium aerolatum]|uniref:Transcriptional regulator n=1 Tax=Methylobacterium aerolatum TaxID=418708 RepID=A0ABU0I5Z4_9HYPH|nr:hypothetical protein [Methylobacterium aerolatum]MDQ0450035.1 hypothetical protein [Methylobacterium aerolatum]
MSTLIGHTPEEREAFIRNSAILAELVVLKTPLVRLAIRHGIPREDLIRDLRSYLGMGVAALEADVDGAVLVGGPPASELPLVATQKRRSLPGDPASKKPAV